MVQRTIYFLSCWRKSCRPNVLSPSNAFLRHKGVFLHGPNHQNQEIKIDTLTPSDPQTRFEFWQLSLYCLLKPKDSVQNHVSHLVVMSLPGETSFTSEQFFDLSLTCVTSACLEITMFPNFNLSGKNIKTVMLCSSYCILSGSICTISDGVHFQQTFWTYVYKDDFWLLSVP